MHWLIQPLVNNHYYHYKFHYVLLRTQGGLKLHSSLMIGPLFDLELWNMYDQIMGDLPGNNAVEGCHRSFQADVGLYHIIQASGNLSTF